MANITLSNSLLNADLGLIVMPVSKAGVYYDDIGYALAEGYGSDYTETGNTQNYKNPILSGDLGDYKFMGSAKFTYDSDDNRISSSVSYSSATMTSSEGTLTVKGSYSYSESYNPSTNKGNATYTLASTGLSFLGVDGSKWSLTGSISERYSYNYYTGDETFKFSSTITAFSSTDSDGNSISYSGKYTWDASLEDYTGYMTSMALGVGSTKLTVSGLKIKYSDIASDNYSIGTVSDLLPSILTGNDVITISSTDPITNGEIYGYAGNDKITGSGGGDVISGDVSHDNDNYQTIKGNDTLLGGAGDDSLDGGYGNDSIDGGDGDDYIYGAGGSDKLMGGNGDDELVAYGVNDILTGGSGSDLFTFYGNYDGYSEVSSAMNTKVTDFKHGTDQLWVWTDEQMTDANFSSGKGMKSSNSEGICYVYDTSAGNLYYDADANGSGKVILIGTFTGKPVITTDDFYWEPEYYA